VLNKNAVVVNFGVMKHINVNLVYQVVKSVQMLLYVKHASHHQIVNQGIHLILKIKNVINVLLTTAWNVQEITLKKHITKPVASASQDMNCGMDLEIQEK
jgi:hypothetical protein